MWPIGAHLKVMCDPDDENSNQNLELSEQNEDPSMHVSEPVQNAEHQNLISGTAPMPTSSGVQSVVVAAEKRKICGNFI